MSATPFTRVKSTVAPRTDLKRWLPADDGEHRAAISHAYRILDGVLDGKGKPLSKEQKTTILRSIAAVPRLSDLGHGARFESAEAWDAAVQRYADRCNSLQQWGVTHEACIQWVHIRDFTHTKDPVEAWFTEVTERLAKGERPPPPVTFADMQAERIERSKKGYVNMTFKTEDAADVKEWTAKRQLCYKAAQDVGRTAITDSEPWLDQVFGKPWKETIRPMSRADVEAKLAEAKAAEVKTDEPEPEAPKAEPEPEAPKVNGKELKEIWGDKLMKRHGRSQAGKVFLEVVGWAKWDDAIDPSKGAMTEQDVVGLIQKHLDALDAATPEAPAKPPEPPITSAVEPPDGYPGEQPEPPAPPTVVDAEIVPTPAAPPVETALVKAPKQRKPRQPMAMLPERERWTIMREQADILIKSGFLPRAVDTPEKAIAIMMMSEAIDIMPIIGLQMINVISGKPTVSPQLMLGLVNRSGQLEDMKITDDGTTCTVTLKRTGRTAYTARFSMDDAKKMGLYGKDNWNKQPAVMRQWRAVSAACRVVFPDIIMGMYLTEELDPDQPFIEAT